MPRKVSDRTLLRRALLGVFELRSPAGSRWAIGVQPLDKRPMVVFPIHVTARRHAAELERLCLDNHLDPLLELFPVGSLGKAVREAARGRPLTTVERRGFTRVRYQGRWVWVYAYRGKPYVYGRKAPRLALVSEAAESGELAGTFAEWQAVVSQVVASNPRQLVVLAHALSAALRRPLGFPSVMLALVAPTSTGKTTTQRIVASMLGKPIVTPWNATSLGLQKWLAERPDQPVTLEDFHRADSADDLAAVIMAAGNSASRITARTRSQGEDAATIESTAIISAERSLVSLLRAGTSGLLARYVEIGTGESGMFDEASPYVDIRTMVGAIDTAVRGNYGVAWPAWLSAVSKAWPSVERLSKKRMAFVLARVLEAAGRPELTELSARLADGIAFSAFAAVMATKLGFWSIPPATIYEAFGLVFKEHLARSLAGGSGFYSQAVEAVSSFIERHRSRFFPLREVHDTTPRHGLVGYTTTIRGKGPVFLFPPGLFAEQFRDYGDEVYEALRNADLLIAQPQRGNRLSVRIPGATDERRSRMEFIAVKEAIRFSIGR